uniref:transposase n=1 Tax=Pelomicrobium sp. TaxID=2815319 RepID=UPI002FDE6FF6
AMRLTRAEPSTSEPRHPRLEHAIGVIKRLFGFTKVRYRGIAKNAKRLFVTCALANLFLVRHRLLQLQEA